MLFEILIVIMTIGFIWMCLIDQNDTPHQRIDVPRQKMNQQMQIICNYRLDNGKHGNQGYQRVLLQLFGLPGNGKSSFINSCKFVIDGVYKEDAKARETDGGCTTRRNTYKLTDVITMVDNRGCPSFTMYEKGEIYAQLGNLVPLDQDVEWCKDFDKNVERLMHGNGNVCDFIVPIYIHSVKNKIAREELDELKDLLNKARELTGINPFIVLTNKSHGGVDAMCSTFKNMGFDKIYAIENYTETDHQKVLEKHEAIQGFLCRVLENVNFNMEDTQNPDADRKKRLTFVIQYINKADLETKEREVTERNQKEQHKKDLDDIRDQRVAAPRGNMNQRMQVIHQYSLDNCKHGNQGYQRVLLQLFGWPGNGKSSFINSCKFVIDGVYREHTDSGNSHGGKTMRRNTYKLTDVIILVDNRGCPMINKFETGEIFAQLGNLVPLDQDVDWCTDFDKNVDRLMNENKNPNVCDFIVPIYIHSVKNTIARQGIDDQKDLLNKARELTGINPFIVLTNKSHGTVEAMCSTFKNMGFDKIYAIENYTEKDHQKVLEKHEEIQGFLCRVLENVNFNMETTRNPNAERMERMKRVMKYMKEADDEKKEREFTERMRRKEEQQSNQSWFPRLYRKS